MDLREGPATIDQVHERILITLKRQGRRCAGGRDGRQQRARSDLPALHFPR